MMVRNFSFPVTNVFALVLVFALNLYSSESFYPHTVKNHVAMNEDLLVRRFKAQDWISCIMACQNDPKCLSYNYQYITNANGLCELYQCGTNQKRNLKDELFYSYGFLFQQLKYDEKMKSCSTGCGLGWIRYKSHCYIAVNVNKTWQEAAQYCKDNGGNLASIHSQEENDFIISISNSLSTPYFWIGLKAAENCAKHILNDGSTQTSSYTNFGSYERGGACICKQKGSSCRCVNVKVHGKFVRYWFHSDCTKQNTFVCKS